MESWYELFQQAVNIVILENGETKMTNKEAVQVCYEMLKNTIDLYQMNDETRQHVILILQTSAPHLLSYFVSCQGEAVNNNPTHLTFSDDLTNQVYSHVMNDSHLQFIWAERRANRRG